MTDAEEILSKAGIFVDDLTELRLLSTEVAENCTALGGESKEFVTLMTQFKTITESLVQAVEEMASVVEKERLRAMASRNSLKPIDDADKKDADPQKIQILVREKQVELERLRVELEAAQRMETEQREYLQQFLSS